jgi:hypothetical protein
LATIEEQRQRIEELEATIERMHTGSAVSAAKWSEAVTVAVDRAEQAESERDALLVTLWEMNWCENTTKLWSGVASVCCVESPCDVCQLKLCNIMPDSDPRALARNPEGPPRRSTRDGEEG